MGGVTGKQVPLAHFSSIQIALADAKAPKLMLVERLFNVIVTMSLLHLRPVSRSRSNSALRTASYRFRSKACERGCGDSSFWSYRCGGII